MKLYRKDIAKIAGVSAQTVSYVLNGSRNFSQETVDKVMDAVQRTGYKPDAIAKGLTKKHLNIVAILIDNFSNPVYSEIMDGFQQEAYKSGYVVVVADLKNRGENIIADLVSMRVAGIYITLGMMETCVKLFTELENNDIKVVFGNKIENNGRQYVFVETDKRRIMHDAVQYLADCGHENIVYFSGLDIHSTSDERCMGFQKAYRERFHKEGIILENAPPYTTDMESGQNIAKHFLQTGIRASAVITTNDLMAIGAIHTFLKAGMRVPEDISVMGIDNIDIARYSTPALTTVGFDKKAYGRKVFCLLKNMIEGADELSQSETFDAEIVERESVWKFN